MAAQSNHQVFTSVMFQRSGTQDLDEHIQQHKQGKKN